MNVPLPAALNATVQTLVNVALTAPAQFKLYHWQTRSYARHKSLDAVQQKLQEKFDQLIETFSGKFNTRIIAPAQFRVGVENMRPNVADDVEIDTIEEFANNVIDTLMGMERALNLPAEVVTDLANIRDDIVGEINRFKYLLRFH